MDMGQIISVRKTGMGFVLGPGCHNAQRTTRGTDLNKNSKLLQGLNIPVEPQPVAILVTDEAEEIRVTIYHQRREEGNRRRSLHHTALIYKEDLGVRSL
jgi:hypothetical protein